MINQLNKAIELIKKTGDRLLIADSAHPEYVSVLMNLNEYEKLILGKSEVRGLTEDELLDKINRDIAIWRNEQEEEIWRPRPVWDDRQKWRNRLKFGDDFACDDDYDDWAELNKWEAENDEILHKYNSNWGNDWEEDEDDWEDDWNEEDEDEEEENLYYYNEEDNQNKVDYFGENLNQTEKTEPEEFKNQFAPIAEEPEAKEIAVEPDEAESKNSPKNVWKIPSDIKEKAEEIVEPEDF